MGSACGSEPKSGGQTISMLARLQLAAFTPDNAVQINCATYNGVAHEAWLIAISVDGFP
jgi:hypothetical protein